MEAVASAADLDAWVARMAAPAVVVGPEGRIVAANPAWQSMTPSGARRGVSVGVGSDYVGVTRGAASRGDPDAALVLGVLEAILGGTADHGDVDYPCPDVRNQRWYRMSAYLLDLDRPHALVVHRPTAPPPPLVGDGVDGTGVVHDLRNAMHTASGFAEMLQDQGEAADPESRHTWVAAIGRQLDRAQQLLAAQEDQIEGVSRVATPDAVPVAEALQMASELAGVEHVVAGDVGLVVRCDLQHLVRVFTNLLTNADKYGRPPVRVVASRVGPRVHLDVTDDGDGIPPDLSGRLFALYARSRDHVAGPQPGSGIGLAIVRELLRVNGGTILHQPDWPGAGFRIDLPAADVPG